MYLEYFDFREFPFVLTPDTHYFCNLTSYQEALNVLLLSLRSGEGFIKIIGEVGTGKTLLCRALLDRLGGEYVTAYVSDPYLSCFELRKALAQELEIKFSDKIGQHALLNLITEKLLELNKQGKRVVVIIDESQLLSDKALEGLRLLSNLETEKSKLLQIVLFAQPELDKRLSQPGLRQLKQRIVFSYYLQPINKNELKLYVNHRLNKSGNQNPGLFTPKSFKLLHKASGGIPRLINVLCHKALMVAYGMGSRQIGVNEVMYAIKDTDGAKAPIRRTYFTLYNSLIFLVLIIIGFGLYLMLRHFK